MSCKQCVGVERMFGERVAQSDLERYRRRGLRRTTSLLVGELLRHGVAGAKLLDIGAGVGAISHALLDSGAQSARLVDGSSAYLAAAAREARRRGMEHRYTYRHGDFVEVAAEEEQAEIVTLDRVICCYDDVTALISASASKAGRLYGLVYPRDLWWTRLGVRAANLVLRLTRSPFRSFVHPQPMVDAAIATHGLVPVFHRDVGVWQVAVYRKG